MILASCWRKSPAVFCSAAISSAREAVEAFKAGQLQSVADANVQAGMGMGGGMGMGRGMGAGRGAAIPAPAASPSAPATSRDEEIAALQEAAVDLQKQLAEVMARLERLQK
ncbi:MAG: DUF5320 family protein [Thermoflexales bacterium]|nr:DUF5320 family protein [Thermoflexales bacterium]